MALQDLDALLHPTVRVFLLTREELDDWKWMGLTFPTDTLMTAQADLPANSVPVGFAEIGGVPVGFELVGRPYD
jgi:amidase